MARYDGGEVWITAALFGLDNGWDPCALCVRQVAVCIWCKGRLSSVSCLLAQQCSGSHKRGWVGSEHESQRNTLNVATPLVGMISGHTDPNNGESGTPQSLCSPFREYFSVQQAVSNWDQEGLSTQCVLLLGVGGIGMRAYHVFCPYCLSLVCPARLCPPLPPVPFRSFFLRPGLIGWARSHSASSSWASAASVRPRLNYSSPC